MIDYRLSPLKNDPKTPFAPQHAIRPKTNTNKPLHLDGAVSTVYFYNVKTTFHHSQNKHK